ncbi:GatB/YqeY domain-containing protein [uncultured Pseudoramibacter sp.]|uniref:GatB/YqeY domain-containing protein n=1 Tax=Candidatus Pseudoramibacter fermentans TaxID=2594427 RepID=A0A6L5GR46_9FIRM|nr:GatB/YqeY domain-containing protein [uncultured Pseudoramibacter sp.]MQM72719.1 GatB/YqeY domain-containing protein [Candidatus Pseudoramibacter fermentans]RRF93922.1 MAG: GatB/YqeY domain-containing protein [Eubacteriaceae bacterium]
MALKKQLLTDLKAAMKAKDKVRKSTITLIRAAILQEEKDKQIDNLEDSDIEAIISKQYKQRKDSLKEFEKAGRDDLIEQTKAEMAIIEDYLPKQLSQEEIGAIVEDTIQEIGAESMKDMGKVMKAIMPKVKGKADGKVVNQIVREKLN